MPIFKYRGYNQRGAEIDGLIEADGQRDAAIKIKAGGVFPREITENVFSEKRFSFNRPSPFVLSAITRSLSVLLSSGVPLTDAINSISSEQKGVWKGILTEIKEELAGGSTLARAMQAHTVFPEFYTGMIAAGEKSGKLTEVLLKLADYLEREANTKNKVKTALIYPVFMASVSILIVSFLFTFVIPKITRIFEGTSASLPFITVILIWITTVFQKFWWLVLSLIAGAVILFRKIIKTKKEIIDSFLLRDPTGILMSLYMLRFSMTMSFLLSGGLQILSAMKLTSKATGNVVLEKRIIAAQELVTQGARLSTSLEGFPPTLLQIIATGEQTGRLPEVLNNTAASYEAEFDRRLQRAVGLLEPVLILVMGLIVGFIVLAVLLPIFELNQLIK
ncbi:MAG: type II secretion system F family protein [Nitrospirae bacterium]|nr:type II secretion system F family protein [Nitrospirota bacterium]